MYKCLAMSSIKLTRGSSHKYAVQGKRTKDALSKEEQELFELCSLAGVDMGPAVFRNVLDLLRMNVSPVAIVQMLKSMVHRSTKSSTTAAFQTTSSIQTPSSYITEPSKNTNTAISSGILKTKDNQHSSKLSMKTSKSRPTGKYLHKT